MASPMTAEDYAFAKAPHAIDDSSGGCDEIKLSTYRDYLDSALAWIEVAVPILRQQDERLYEEYGSHSEAVKSLTARFPA